jgi:hypothetical protein
MLEKVLTGRPFEYGNLRTAFLALLAFLTANKYGVKGEDSRVAEVIRAVADRKMTAPQAIEEIAEPTNLALRPGVTLRTLVSHLINERKGALRLLTDGDEPASR